MSGRAVHFCTDAAALFLHTIEDNTLFDFKIPTVIVLFLKFALCPNLRINDMNRKRHRNKNQTPKNESEVSFNICKGPKYDNHNMRKRKKHPLKTIPLADLRSENIGLSQKVPKTNNGNRHTKYKHDISPGLFPIERRSPGAVSLPADRLSGGAPLQRIYSFSAVKVFSGNQSNDQRFKIKSTSSSCRFFASATVQSLYLTISLSCIKPELA